VPVEMCEIGSCLDGVVVLGSSHTLAFVTNAKSGDDQYPSKDRTSHKCCKNAILIRKEYTPTGRRLQIPEKQEIYVVLISAY